MAAILELPGVSNGLSERSSALVTTLPNLPSELLFLIIHDLNNQSLFNLGLTCRRMNTVAFNYFFCKNDIQDPARGYFLPNSSGKHGLPIQTIAALRSALYVHHLLKFDFILGPGGKRMLEEVADLCVLATRLHSIKIFKLSFRHIDDGLFHLRGMRILDTADVTTWYKTVTGLLDNVLDKSCNELHIEGGYHFPELYRGLIQTLHAPPLVRVHNQPKSKMKVIVTRLRRPFNSLRRLPILKQKATSILPLPQTTVNGALTHQTVQLHKEKDGRLNSSDIQLTNVQNAGTEPSFVNSKHATQEIPLSQRNLIAAQIHSDMLLRFPFSKWTLSTLNTASSTLTSLSFEMMVEADVTWKTFSASLTLPLLKSFSLTRNFFVPVRVVEFVDIEAFLMNHPSIQDLHLYGVQLPPSLEVVPRPTFQNLVKFNGHPSYITWLLNRVKLDETALPNLENLKLSSENYIRSTRFNYTLFEPALEVIAKSRRNIVLAFNFNVNDDMRHMNNWLLFHIHICKGQGHQGSIFSRLSNISTLVLCNIYDLWKDYTPDMLPIIPSWLQLFPSLRHLTFERNVYVNGNSEPADLIDTEFAAAVASLCPGLETMAVNWVVNEQITKFYFPLNR